MSTVVVSIDVPDQFRRKAEYVFSVFSSAWGLSVRMASNPSEPADVVYGWRPPNDEARVSVTIPFDPTAYVPSTTCEMRTREGLPTWCPKEGSERDGVDLVGTTYRLLTLLAESQIAEEDRDDKGTFPLEALPPARKDAATVPLVESHAQVVFQAMVSRRPDLAPEAVPRWPGGFKYAICLTHDTDAATLAAPAELGTNFAKAVLRGDAHHLKMFLKGLLCLGRPKANPLFGFPRWQSYEASLGMKSCFYLAPGVLHVKRHLNDCKSTVFRRGTDWEILRRMAENGWEFGVHPSIHARQSLDSLVAGKSMVEKELGRAVFGVRHHYWSVDWRRPQETLRKHIEAGFRYDSSLAWRGAGFRAGTCLPYQPFDPERNEPLPICELPPSLMDAVILGQGLPLEEAIRQGREVVQRVKEYGGVAVLNWHTETACDDFCYRGYFSALRDLLDPLLRENDVWCATPWELARHWRERNEALGNSAC